MLSSPQPHMLLQHMSIALIDIAHRLAIHTDQTLPSLHGPLVLQVAKVY